MGGYGSGIKYWRSAKEKVENCRSIDANSFSRWGYFKPGGRGGITRWTRNGMETGSCWVYTNIDNTDDSISFSYKYDDKPHPDVKVKLSWYSPGFGGRRYFFICPVCGKRMRTLHFKYGEIACRTCHNLTYESCVENHRIDNLCKAMAGGLNASWQDVKSRMNELAREWRKEPKRPRGRPRKHHPT